MTDDGILILIPENKSSLQNQIIAVFICTLGTFSLGTSFGWLSPVLDDLQNVENSILNSPMNDEEIAWAGGLLCIGAMVGQPIFNIVSKKQGRKISAYVAGLPMAISFIIKTFANTSFWILVSQFLSGFGGAGGLALPPLYISETVEPRARGTLSSLIMGQYSFGIFVSYLLGAIFSYKTFTILTLIPPVLFMIAFWFMPESPLYNLQRGCDEEAAKAVAWLRKLPLNSIEVRSELITLARQLRGLDALDAAYKPTKDDLIKEMELINKGRQKSKTIQRENTSLDQNITPETKSSWKAIWSSRAAIHGLILCNGMLVFQTAMGLVVIAIFASFIFESVHIKVSTDIGSIIYSVILITGCLIASATMDLAGRRILLISSCFIVFVCEVILGVFFQFSAEDFAPDWLSWTALISLAISVISFNTGAGNVPFIVLAEYFSAEVRDIANNIVLTVSWILAFLLVQYFTPSVNYFGTANVFYFFAMNSLIFGIVSYFFIPETKGKTQDEILHDLETKICYHKS